MLLKKRKMKQKAQRLRNNSTTRRLRRIYRLKQRVHSRHRVGFMVWQEM